MEGLFKHQLDRAAREEALSLPQRPTDRQLKAPNTGNLNVPIWKIDAPDTGNGEVPNTGSIGRGKAYGSSMRGFWSRAYGMLAESGSPIGIRKGRILEGVWRLNPSRWRSKDDGYLLARTLPANDPDAQCSSEPGSGPGKPKRDYL